MSSNLCVHYIISSFFSKIAIKPTIEDISQIFIFSLFCAMLPIPVLLYYYLSKQGIPFNCTNSFWVSHTQTILRVTRKRAAHDRKPK